MRVLSWLIPALLLLAGVAQAGTTWYLSSDPNQFDPCGVEKNRPCNSIARLAGLASGDSIVLLAPPADSTLHSRHFAFSIPYSDPSATWTQNITFVGEDGRAVLNLEGSNSSFSVLGPNTRQEFRGITFANASAFSVFIVNGGHLVLENCSFIDNASPNGSCIRQCDGLSVIRDCTFLRNGGAESNLGGAVLIEDGVALISNSNFSSNQAHVGSAICLCGSPVVSLTEIVINDNGAPPSVRGGGIAAISSGASLTIQKAQCYGNLVGHNSSGGGCLSFECVSGESILSLRDVTLEHNTAAYGGNLLVSNCMLDSLGGLLLNVSAVSLVAGSALVSGGNLALLNTEIRVHVPNQDFSLRSGVASAHGGNVFVDNGSVMTASGLQIIDGNAILDGGCIFAAGASTVVLQNTFVSRCSAGRFGGAIFSAARSFTLKHDVVFSGALSAKGSSSIPDANAGALLYVNSTVDAPEMKSTAAPALIWDGFSTAAVTAVFPLFYSVPQQYCHVEVRLGGMASMLILLQNSSLPVKLPLSFCARTGPVVWTLQQHSSDTSRNSDVVSIAFSVGRLRVSSSSSVAFVGAIDAMIEGGLLWTGGELMFATTQGMGSLRSTGEMNVISPLPTTSTNTHQLTTVFGDFNITQTMCGPPTLLGTLSVLSPLVVNPPPVDPRNRVPCLVFKRERFPWNNNFLSTLSTSPSYPTTITFGSGGSGECSIVADPPGLGGLVVVSAPSKLTFNGRVDFGGDLQLTTSKFKKEGPDFEFFITNRTFYGQVTNLAVSPSPLFPTSTWKIAALPGSNFAASWQAYPKSLFQFVTTAGPTTPAVFDLPPLVAVPGLDTTHYRMNASLASFELIGAVLTPAPHVHAPELDPHPIPPSAVAGMSLGALGLIAVAVSFFFYLKIRRDRKRRDKTNRKIPHDGLNHHVATPIEQEPLLLENTFDVEMSHSRSNIAAATSSNQSGTLFDMSGDNVPHLSHHSSDYIETSTSSGSSGYVYTHAESISLEQPPEGTTPESLAAAWQSPLSGFRPEWLIDFSDLILDSKLGQGAFGVVWRGKWKAANVAIKQASGISLDERILEEFKKEALLLLNLRPHPNIVQMLGVCMHGSSIYMVLELCSGGSVDQLFGKSSLTLDRKLRIILGIARGLQHLHSNRIIHRDVRTLFQRLHLIPDDVLSQLAARNILLSGDVAKISDFGLSRLVEEHCTAGVSRSDFGPVKYMAPECIKRREYSFSSDMWSFGVCVVEILTEQPPYPDLDHLTAATRVRDKGLSPTIPPEAPDWIKDICRSCFSADPAQRPSASDVAWYILDRIPDEQ